MVSMEPYIHLSPNLTSVTQTWCIPVTFVASHIHYFWSKQLNCCLVVQQLVFQSKGFICRSPEEKLKIHFNSRISCCFIPIILIVLIMVINQHQGQKHDFVVRGRKTWTENNENIFLKNPSILATKPFHSSAAGREGSVLNRLLITMNLQKKNAASECRMGNYFVFKAKITAEGLKKVRWEYIIVTMKKLRFVTYQMSEDCEDLDNDIAAKVCGDDDKDESEATMKALLCLVIQIWWWWGMITWC